MRLTAPVVGLALGVLAGIAILLFVDGCTDPKAPFPCTGTEVWPDPCSYSITETVTEAGADAR